MRGARRYCVVGDSFGAFAKNSGVLTVSRALELLRTSALEAVDLFLGLGLSETDRRALCAAGADPALARASLALTHKHFDEHVMIGPMEQAGSSVYVCSLVVNSSIDRLSDHVTGQHLGGMLLIEAARQAGTAVIELEYRQSSPRKLGVAWSALQVRFHAFAFPIPATLRTRVIEASVCGTEPPKLQLETTVEQAGNVVCTVAGDLTLFDAALLQKLEAVAGARAARKLDKLMLLESER
jgi:hypothetical protein